MMKLLILPVVILLIAFAGAQQYPPTNLPSSSINTFSQSINWDYFGYNLENLGDIDGDGFDDILVGAPILANYQNAAGEMVYVINGKTGSVIYSYSGPLAPNQDGFGEGGLARLSDLNNDGVSEFAIGAPFETITGHQNQASGRVHVYDGATGNFLFNIDPPTFPVQSIFNGFQTLAFGHDVVNIGDITGDGIGEVLITGLGIWLPGQSGLGADAGWVLIYDLVSQSFISQSPGPINSVNFGTSIDNLGDINNDLIPEVIVSDPGFGANSGGVISQVGRVYVYSVSDFLNPVYTLNSLVSTFFTDFGIDVSAGGDFNADGIQDFIVGERLGNNNGVAYVFSGSNGGLISQFSGIYFGGGFGRNVELSDVTGDGVADAVISSPYSGSSAGGALEYVEIYSGPSGNLLQTWNTQTIKSSFGSGLAIADVKGDGLNDIIIGAPQFGQPINQVVPPGFIQTHSLGGAEEYGNFANNGLKLRWISFNGALYSSGTIKISGVSPGQAIFLGVSTAHMNYQNPQNLQVQGNLLIDTNDPNFKILQGQANPNGEIEISGISYLNGGLAGITAYVQAWNLQQGNTWRLSDNALAITFVP